MLADRLEKNVMRELVKQIPQSAAVPHRENRPSFFRGREVVGGVATLIEKLDSRKSD